MKRRCNEPVTRVVLGLALALVASTGSLKAQTAPAPTGFLYVGANDARPGMNAVFGFTRHVDGSLTPLPGSPFSTGGTGVTNPKDDFGPQDADQNLIISPDRHRLFVVNGGSNSIAVFNIGLDGSLTAVPGSPFPSGGIQPISLGLAGDKLYVVNKDNDPLQPSGNVVPNYTGFRVMPDGSLVALPNSTVAAAAGSSPSQALIAPSGDLLFVADFFGGDLRSFKIQPDGRLLEAPNSPQSLPPFLGTSVAPLPVGLPPLPLGLTTHPTLPILYAGVPTSGKLTVYRYDPATGALALMNYAGNTGSALCWIIHTADGKDLYTVSQFSNSVSWYSISKDPMNPVELQHLTIGTGALNEETLDPAEQYLYVVQSVTATNPTMATSTSNAIIILKRNTDRSLSMVSTFALPAGTTYRAQGIAAF